MDPSGAVAGYKAISAGTKEQEALTHLEKAYKKSEGNWDEKQTVHTAISVLQQVISSDFKASDIEVGMATVDNPRFMKLTEEEIERHLNELAER
eukprot:NODE_3440_length_774_cov_76.462069_g2875_i0.p2 GENE.NODE_3440_length_774_cov_76.462069_g2875_i0~~NODE_3440_length_774_cov_76.462069_g2875_i0.p2  ORF type:complete len:94 (-),score=24.53 NODE_3440_length_774_cov_76.462069_g2875_i0:24-305(-)